MEITWLFSIFLYRKKVGHIRHKKSSNYATDCSIEKKTLCLKCSLGILWSLYCWVEGKAPKKYIVLLDKFWFEWRIFKVCTQPTSSFLKRKFLLIPFKKFTDSTIFFFIYCEYLLVPPRPLEIKSQIFGEYGRMHIYLLSWKVCFFFLDHFW